MMKKNLLLLFALASFVFIGCNKGDDGDDGGSGGKTIEEIEKLPYSELTPAEQKDKLGTEGIELVDMMSHIKNSPAIDALYNIQNLLGIATPDFGKTKATVEIVKELYQIADIYGVFAWNAKDNKWDKTASDKELKLSFPSKKNGATNDATLVVTAVNSGKKFVKNEYEYDSNWDEEKQDYVKELVGTTEITVNLPSSATATLTIGGKEQVKITFTGDYTNDGVPTKLNTEMIVAEGYKLTESFNKGAKIEIILKMTYNGKVMFEAGAVGEDFKLDEIIEDAKNEEDLNKALLGEANAYMYILQNLSLVSNIDAKGLATEMDKIDAKYIEPKWNSKEYYTTINKFRKDESEAIAAANNKYQKTILASRTHGTQIATIEFKSKLVYTYTDYRIWNEIDKYWFSDENENPENKVTEEEYEEVICFRFGDGTLVEAEVYFTTGFTAFETKWNNFVNSLQK